LQSLWGASKILPYSLLSGLTVLQAHPKATDNSIHYIVIPNNKSPFGKITIHWWSGANWGVLFDFYTNIEECKIIIHKDLVVMLQVENDLWEYNYLLEDSFKASIASNSHFEYPLNANEIVEQQWNALQCLWLAL
jgi:hypothetical protein